MGLGPFVARLRRGEKILWQGRPGRGLLLPNEGNVAILIGVLGCGFGCLFLLLALVDSRHDLLTRFLIGGGACIGFYYAFGRLIIDAYLRRYTEYAVTDRRILIHRGGYYPGFTFVSLYAHPDIHLIGSRERGTLRFGPPFDFRSKDRAWIDSLDEVPQFIGIDEPEKVLAIIRKAEASLEDVW